MTLEEIISGNKSIAEFMGSDFNDVFDSCRYELYERGHRNPEYLDNHANHRCYHFSWDWLIPVVEKISNIKYKTYPLIVTISVASGIYIGINPYNVSGEIYSDEMLIVNTLNLNYFAETEVQDKKYTFIESVWIGVIEFIKWYNQNQNKE